MPVLQFVPVKTIIVMKSLRNTSEPYVKLYSSLSLAIHSNEEIRELYVKFGDILSVAVIEIGLPLSLSSEQLSSIAVNLLRSKQVDIAREGQPRTLNTGAAASVTVLLAATPDQPAPSLEAIPGRDVRDGI